VVRVDEGGEPKLHEKVDPVRDYWLNNLWTDLAIAATLVGAHLVLVAQLPVLDVLGNSAPADRRAAYSSVAVVVSLLGSFSAVAIGQLSAAKGARADSLRDQGGTTLAKNWRSIFLAGLGTAGISILALLVDPSRHTLSWWPVVIRWVFEFALLVAVVKFFRLSVLFYEVLAIATLSAKEGDDKPLGPAVTASKRWKDKKAS